MSKIDEAIKRVYSILEEIEKETHTDILISFRIDLAFYMLYLSKSDNNISDEELTSVIDITKLDLTPKELLAIAGPKGVLTEDYPTKVPESFRALVDIDKKTKAEGGIAAAAPVVLLMYEVVGEHLMKADGATTEDEMVNYKAYLNMLDDYRKKELLNI
jgi:hypothetical protein